MHHAAAAGVVATMIKLRDLGGDINVPNHCNATPLHAAASTGRIEALLELITSGVTLNSVDTKGGTAVHYAVERCQVGRLALRL